MTQAYPDRHHPIFWLQDSLQALGAETEFNGRDERTLGCWGLIINGRPMVWLIDNRWLHEREKEDPAAKQLLDSGAVVCHAQKPDMERVGGHWLPLAVTPGYAPPDKPVAKLFDCAFTGYIRDRERMSALLDIHSHFTLSVQQGVFGTEAVRHYHEARLGVNIPTRYGDANAYDVNMRVFEILATSTPLVTPDEPYMAELGLYHGVNCFLYRHGELLDVIGSALSSFDLEAVGRAGAQLAEERHTYETRAKQVLEWIE